MCLRLLSVTIRDGARSHEEVDARGAGAVAHQRHVGLVAAEERYVLLYPVQCCDLVHKSIVGG